MVLCDHFHHIVLRSSVLSPEDSVISPWVLKKMTVLSHPCWNKLWKLHRQKYHIVAREITILIYVSGNCRRRQQSIFEKWYLTLVLISARLLGAFTSWMCWRNWVYEMCWNMLYSRISSQVWLFPSLIEKITPAFHKNDGQIRVHFHNDWIFTLYHDISLWWKKRVQFGYFRVDIIRHNTVYRKQIHLLCLNRCSNAIPHLATFSFLKIKLV